MQATFNQIALAAVLVLALAACASSSSKPSPTSNANALPSWYLATDGDSPFAYVGVGEGLSKNEAEQAALAEIAGKVSTRVSSSLQSSQSQAEFGGQSSYSSNVERKLRAEVDAIEFNNYNLTHLEQRGGLFYARVSVDRDLLFMNQYRRWQEQDARLSADWRRLNDGDALEQLQLSASIRAQIEDGLALLALLRVIKTSDELDPERASYLARLPVLEAAKDDIYVRFDSKGADLRGLENALAAALSAEQIKVIEQRTAGIAQEQVLQVVIERSARRLELEVSSPDLQDAHFATVDVSLSSYNSAGELLSQHTISTRNISKTSYQAAVDSVKGFEKRLAEVGVINALFASGGESGN